MRKMIGSAAALACAATLAAGAPAQAKDPVLRPYVLASEAPGSVADAAAKTRQSLAGAGFSYVLGSVRMGWQLVMELSAGIGLVLLQRWYWWRVNAWSEIAAMVAPFFGYWCVKKFTALHFPESVFFIPGIIYEGLNSCFLIRV